MPRTAPASRLLAIAVADDASAWRAAGFSVSPDGVCRVGDTDFVLAGRSAAPDASYPVLRWLMYREGAPPGETRHDVAGLDVRVTGTMPTRAPEKHPNYATGVDHAVVQTPHVGTVVDAFSKELGLKPRRRGAVRNRPGLEFAFFRLDDGCIIEVVGPDGSDPKVKPQSPIPRLWGITFSVSDVMASHAHLSKVGAARKLRKAVQGGHIFPLDKEKVGMGMDSAFISERGADVKAKV
ncbi:hypothetical protein DFJ74DRAFT_683822 [Hyaloraphidium curvatum]|nr:hypothetical protein DFJ74DRAFT_683822 [Hyaloraphidium curvatum]